jgi:hypothetical protein
MSQQGGSQRMRKIRDSSEDEMIAIFLQTELHSSRFHQAIGELMQQEGIDPHVVEAPDWSNAHENALRRALLGVYRGYGRNADYFQGFPTNVRWERVTLTRQELEQVRYIEYDYWVELSGGTRMAIDGARNALVGKVVFRVSSDGLVYMANQLRQGAQFPPLILVTKHADAYLVVMEGHVRLTAYLIAPEYILSELEVILGTSAQITNWGCY